MTDLELYLSMVKAFEKAAHLLMEGRKEQAHKFIERDTPWRIYEYGVDLADNSKKDGFDAACCRYVLASFDAPYFGQQQDVMTYLNQYLQLSSPKSSLVFINRQKYLIDWQKVDAVPSSQLA